MSANYLIIGASSGIGEACARELAADDTTLVLVARNREKMLKLKDELPGRIYVAEYDLNDLNHISSIFDICATEGIRFDGMVFSAGVDGTWPIKTNNVQKMQEMMNVNCFSFVELSKSFYLRRNSNDGAAIVAISSIASKSLDKGMSAYCASKAALNSYVKIMAKEFISRKVRVNAILPAGVDTPMSRKKMELLSVEDAGNLIPAENIAKQAAYLLSEEALYINGELLSVGAGLIY